MVHDTYLFKGTKNYTRGCVQITDKFYSLFK